MAELLWTPQEHLGQATWGFVHQSRIRRFLALSTVVHVAVAALSPWLLLTFTLTGREEQLVIRSVDFFPAPEAAPVAAAPEVRGRSGEGSSAPRTAARAAPRVPAPPAKSAPVPAPAPAPVPESAVTTAPVPEPIPAPAPRPRELPSIPTDPRGSTPVPYDTARPSVPSVPATEPGRGEAGHAAALARDVAGRGETGPRATIEIPRSLARGSSGGAGGAGSGSGVGSATGSGEGAAGRTGAGLGSALVDTRDPDFSEYFRVIEARVRAAWKYPENLGGTTQTVRLGFSLRVDGAVDDVRVVSSTSGVMNDSALTAVRKAAPFPPLPAKLRSLVGQPLVMSFTVTIK